MTSLLIAGLSANSFAKPWPEPLHIAAVVGEDAALPPSVSQKTKEGLRTFLTASPAFELLSDTMARDRLGMPIARLDVQCLDRSCWARACERLGVDLLLHAEIKPTGDREEVLFRLYRSDQTVSQTHSSHLLPRGGGAPLEGLEQLLHQPGSIRIALENGSTHLRVNGQPRLLGPHPSVTVSNLPPGNHEIVVEGLGLPQRLEVVRLLPGEKLALPLPPSSSAKQAQRQKWWGAWAGGALLLGGSIAILSGTGRSGSAWR